MTTHSETACDQVAAAVAQSDALDELYSRPDKAAPHLVAAAHDKLRRSIKVAEVHALLAIAAELEKMNQPLVIVEPPTGDL